MPQTNRFADFLIATVAAIALLASPATASQKDVLDCSTNGWFKLSTDAHIAACTRVLANGDAKSRADAFDTRGVLLANQKRDYDRAIADFDQAIRLYPNRDGTYRNRGDAWRSKGEHDRAIADYTEAIRLKPEEGSYYQSRGAEWSEIGEYDRAFADGDAAVRLDPKFSSSYYSRGYALKKLGNMIAPLPISIR
jgi:tetratricopeptide (TPR) repeat protein